MLSTIRNMEHAVKEPLPPSMPNVEEIHAMNRLSEKLNQISQRIHQKPTEVLHQEAHAQDAMLERASNLIRKMSNSVDSSHNENFLTALHQLLHKNHLHDHKFMSSLENEIAYAIANGTPLSMPREYDHLYNTKASGKLLDLNHPVTGTTADRTQQQQATTTTPSS
jgi:hypothetical protein